MLSSTYDILELFDNAFARAGSVPSLIQIDCSGKTRYAEGTTSDGIAWRIEADILNRLHVDVLEMRRGYAHLGEQLLVPFYQVAKAKVEGFGWAGKDIETHAFTAMAPVLSAMRFNMGMAAKKGWLDSQVAMDNSGAVRSQPPNFTIEQAISWTHLGRPGRWTSMELMSMLIELEKNGHYLDNTAGKHWIDSHEKKHRQVAALILNTIFATSQSGQRLVQIDSVKAVQAWKSWWMQMPPEPMGNTLLAVLDNFSQKKAEALVEGWYLRVAQSKELGKRTLAGMEHHAHAFPTNGAWKAFRKIFEDVALFNWRVVWKEKEAQAWLLNKATSHASNLDGFSAMQNNRVHDYLSIARNLDPTQTAHELYPLWCALQAQPAQELLDPTGLFEEPVAMNANS